MTSSVPSHKLQETSVITNEWNTCTKNDWPTTRQTTNLPRYHWKNSYDTIWSTKSDKRTITTSRSRKELHTTTAKKKKKATNYIMVTKMILGFNWFLHMYLSKKEKKTDSFTCISIVWFNYSIPKQTVSLLHGINTHFKVSKIHLTKYLSKKKNPLNKVISHCIVQERRFESDGNLAQFTITKYASIFWRILYSIFEFFMLNW